MNRAALNNYRDRFWAWADSRRPAAQRQHLNRRSLFIFPSRAGFGFLLLTFVLWLVGTNYENNLVLGLGFMLIALFVLSILHTFANLSGVSVQLMSASPAISGERAEIKLLLTRDGRRPRDSIQLCWAGSEIVVINLLEQAETIASVFVPTQGRGWCNPGRLVVESRFPLGIVRCWTRLDMKCRVLVYPKPVPAGPLPQAHAINQEGDTSTWRGTDEFAGYKDYRPGDSLRNVAWKHYARGMGLHSKEYVANTDSRLWLDWDYFAGMNWEARLSRLCYWVLQVSRTDTEYGLRLPGESLPPGSGQTHCDQALRMLALFGADETGESRLPGKGNGARSS
ncbi:MAG: DUF58 domain-containing protein [Cellvibrionaceae bacterium]